MPFAFENRWWLAAFALLAGVAILLWQFSRAHSGHWRVACIGLPMAGAMLASLALADPVLIHNPQAQRIVILLDLSPSARSSPWQSPAWVRNLAIERLAERTLLTVVSFGGKSSPRMQFEDLPLSAAESRWPLTWNFPDPGEGSDVNSAIGYRTPGESRHEIPLAPRWVITDGLLDKSEVGAVAAPLAWTAIAPTAPDFAVSDLVVRNVNQSAELLAQISATAAGESTLEILRDKTSLSRQRIVFTSAGARWITLRDAAAGTTAQRYEVVITPQDPWPENDRASALWQPDNAPARVAIFGSDVDVTAQRTVSAAADFPADAQSLLASAYQVVILNDLSLEALPAHAPAVLERFVRDTGGGLLILGRQNAFGPGRYGESSILEGLSPLASQQEDRPAAHIVFLLDGSGSMNDAAAGTGEQKFRLAVRGVEQAVALLHDHDRISVLAFNDRTTLLADTTRAQLKAFDAVQPTGNTVPDSALPEVARLLAVPASGEKPPLKMLVLLTDGEIPRLDTARWKQMLEQTKTTLTVVAPPPGGASALGELARQSSAIWLRTNDPAQWAMLLKRAIAEKLTGKSISAELAWRTTPASTPEIRGTALQSIQVWKKNDAREIATAQTDPQRVLAAVAQRGLGKVAALAIDAGRSPAAWQRLVQEMLREIAPPAGDRRFTLTAQRDGESWRIAADAIDGGKFLDGQRLQFRLVSDVPQSLGMPQVAPGRYELQLRSAGPFAGIVVRSTDTGEQLVGRIQPARLAVSEYPASYERAPAAPPDTWPISADPARHERWTPRLVHIRLRMAPYLWLAGISAALLALGLRRGPIRRMSKS